jgi:hypothetical protein
MRMIVAFVADQTLTVRSKEQEAIERLSAETATELTL